MTVESAVPEQARVADAVERFLVTQGDVPAESVVRLAGEPSRADVLAKAGAVMQAAGPGDRVWVHFQGPVAATTGGQITLVGGAPHERVALDELRALAGEAHLLVLIEGVATDTTFLLPPLQALTRRHPGSTRDTAVWASVGPALTGFSLAALRAMGGEADGIGRRVGDGQVTLAEAADWVGHLDGASWRQAPVLVTNNPRLVVAGRRQAVWR